MLISSKVLSITGINDQRYWNYIPTNESRYYFAVLLAIHKYILCFCLFLHSNGVQLCVKLIWSINIFCYVYFSALKLFLVSFSIEYVVVCQYSWIDVWQIIWFFIVMCGTWRPSLDCFCCLDSCGHISLCFILSQASVLYFFQTPKLLGASTYVFILVYRTFCWGMVIISNFSA